MALTAGLGLQPQHFDAANACRAPVLSFEVHPQNYMVARGPRLIWLDAIRAADAALEHCVQVFVCPTTWPTHLIGRSRCSA
jgi:uncharacterized protein (UPF0276 family)